MVGTSKFISADASITQELIPETPPPSFAGGKQSKHLFIYSIVCVSLYDFLKNAFSASQNIFFFFKHKYK